MCKKLTTQIFIERAKKVHGDKYDYSKVVYKGYHEKVCIICPIHGEFWQMAQDHLRGHGCSKCNGGVILSNNKWLQKFNEIHNGKYKYIIDNKLSANSKIKIICPIHGLFEQTCMSHSLGYGCPKCGAIKNGINRRMKLSDFIEKAKEIHGDKYDYSKVDYKNNSTKVCIICLEHGEFWQIPNSHLLGHGCPKCVGKNKTTEEFISEAKKKHKGKYDYSKVNYINSDTKICIICPEHGEFWQTPSAHLNGRGCPKCKASHLENEMRNILSSNSIDFEEQKKFTWLGRQSLGFYLPKYHIGIECQGKQHFKPIDFFGGEKKFKHLNELDKNKKKLCNEHKIKILYYSNKKFNDNIIIDKKELIKKIYGK